MIDKDKTTRHFALSQILRVRNGINVKKTNSKSINQRKKKGKNPNEKSVCLHNTFTFGELKKKKRKMTKFVKREKEPLPNVAERKKTNTEKMKKMRK